MAAYTNGEQMKDAEPQDGEVFKIEPSDEIRNLKYSVDESRREFYTICKYQK